MAIDPLWIGVDFDLGYTAATAALTGEPLNSGTCTYVLKDSAGETVGSGALAYVAASDGDYYGTIESAVTTTLEDGAEYVLTINFVQGGYNDRRVLNLFAAYRRQ